VALPGEDEQEIERKLRESRIADRIGLNRAIFYSLDQRIEAMLAIPDR
jgi:hypothetical protein